MARRYRLLYVLEACVGGTREHILQVLHGLDRSRFAPVLLCSIGRDRRFLEDIEQLRRSGVEVVIVPMAREISPWRDLRAFAAIVGRLMRRRYDVVHTHSSKAGFLGRLAARLTGVRRVWHTGHIFAFQWRPQALSSRFYRLLEWFAARLCDRLVALSPQQRTLLVRSGVARPRQICVIENGVRLGDWSDLPPRREARDRLGVPGDGPLVGMAGRLEPQKGSAHFLRAAKLVRAELPQARFVLVGEGSRAPQLAVLAEELGLGDGFRMLGHRSDMRSFYAALDLFVLTSLWEGMPYVVLEAMAAGCAVCATDVPGTREIISDGKTGVLAPAEDDAALAQRIIELLRRPQLRSRLAQKARETVAERFTSEKFLARLQQLYLDDLKRRAV